MALDGDGVRVAYICARYPAVSHTFVLREIAALRRQGVEVLPVSVRRVDAADLLTERDRQEGQRTVALLPASPLILARALARLLRAPRGPAALAAAALRAWGLRRPGVRGVLWQLFYLAEALLLWWRCDRAGIRHVHAHFANVAADVALLTRELGAARPGAAWSWSFTMHGPSDLWDVTALRLADKVADAEFVACISDFARSQLMALTPPAVWERLHVVRCAVEDEHLAVVPAPRDAASPSRLLNVGRLAAAKGQTLLVALVAELREQGLDVEVDVIGDGPLREQLDADVAARGLGDVVHLLGARGQDEVVEHLRRADVFVLPSFAEGVPVVAMEAMAAGVPIVTTRIAGIPELIEDGVSGRLVPPGRLDVLVDALRELLSDAPLREAMGQAGKGVVEAGFRADDQAIRLRELFAAMPGCR